MSDFKHKENESLAIIAANSSLPPQEIHNILEEKGYLISEAAVRNYLNRLHREQQKGAAVAVSVVDKTVCEFIAEKSVRYLQLMDENIEQIARILRDEDSEISLRTQDGQIDRRAWGKYSKLLGEQVRNVMSIRPVEPNGNNTRTNINVNVDASLDDLLEKYYNEYNDNKTTNSKPNNNYNIKSDNSPKDIEFVEV